MLLSCSRSLPLQCPCTAACLLHSPYFYSGFNNSVGVITRLVWTGVVLVSCVWGKSCCVLQESDYGLEGHLTPLRSSCCPHSLTHSAVEGLCQLQSTHNHQKHRVSKHHSGQGEEESHRCGWRGQRPMSDPSSINTAGADATQHLFSFHMSPPCGRDRSFHSSNLSGNGN